MWNRKNIRNSALVSVFIITAGGAAILLVLSVLFVAVAILNSDFYGRNDDLKKVDDWPGYATYPDTPEVTVRVVIHRLVEEENSAEVSAIVVMAPSELAKLQKQGDRTLTVSIKDGSATQPFDLGGSIVIPVDPQQYKSGVIESGRFRLPTLSSLLGFPFDDIILYIPVYVRGSNGIDYQFNLEIQRAFPGRMLEVGLNPHETPKVTLSRPLTEKAVVLVSSVVFMVICIIVAVNLFFNSTNLKAADQIVAVAGFIVACAAFRSFFDAPKKVGTSAFEIVVIVLPIVALASGFALTTLRNYLRSRRT
jgi:hypothetical protein